MDTSSFIRRLLNTHSINLLLCSTPRISNISTAFWSATFITWSSNLSIASDVTFLAIWQTTVRETSMSSVRLRFPNNISYYKFSRSIPAPAHFKISSTQSGTDGLFPSRSCGRLSPLFWFVPLFSSLEPVLSWQLLDFSFVLSTVRFDRTYSVPPFLRISTARIELSWELVNTLIGQEINL